MKSKFIIAVLALNALVFSASAQSGAKAASTLPADKARINAGVQSGQLTKAEAARLRARKANVRREQRAYRSDGTVTNAERRDLRKDKAKLSGSIYKQKHDAQVRP